MEMKMFKDLTIDDLEQMRHPDYLGEEAGVLIDAISKVSKAKGLSEEEIRSLTMEEAFGTIGEAFGYEDE
jgi:hypothetical protein